MEYKAKNYDNLLGLNGFSDGLLQNHFALYNGYVNNFNKLNDILSNAEKNEKFGTPEYAELNRRLGWEWNGMRLHELYFENLTKENQKLKDDSELLKKIIEEWGSYNSFEKGFKALSMTRGVGWIILYYDKIGNRLFNVWINEHDVGHLSGAVPLLVLDVFEHAFMLDYGIKRNGYIETFWNIVNWEEAEKRFKENL